MDEQQELGSLNRSHEAEIAWPPISDLFTALAALTPEMRHVLVLAHREADRHGHSYIGAEHVFLAILRERQSVPSQLLRDEPPSSVDDIIAKIDGMLASAGYNRWSGQPKRPG